MKFIIRLIPVYFALQALTSSRQLSNGIPLFRNEIMALQISMKSCIVTVVQHYFGSGSIICMAQSGYMKRTSSAVQNSTFDMVLEDVMDGSDHSVMIKGTITTRRAPNFTNSERVHNYVLFTVSAEDCMLIVNMLMESPSWNPHGKFLIYLLYLKTDWEPIIKDIFAYLWQYFVINVTIMIPDVAAKKTRFFTWMPFDAGNCGKENIQFIRLGICRDRRIFPNQDIVFPPKVRQWRGFKRVR